MSRFGRATHLTRALLLTLALLVAGAAAIGLSIPLGRDWDGGQFVYDLGIAVLLATAVSALLAAYFATIDRQEQQRQARLEQRERQRQQDAARWLEEQERRLASVRSDLDKIARDMADATAETNRVLLEDQVATLSIELTGRLEHLSLDVAAIRRHVDPNYSDPRMVAIDAAAERQGLPAFRPSTPGSGESPGDAQTRAADPPDC